MIIFKVKFKQSLVKIKRKENCTGMEIGFYKFMVRKHKVIETK